MRGLEKALTILEAFAEAERPLGVTELSRLTSLPKSTVARILKTLEAFHYVIQDESRKYRLGSAALRLGQRALRSLPLRNVALPIMREIARRSGETVLLLVLNERHDRAVCIERIESSYGIRLSVEVGKQMYLHAGASAKALLAYMPDQEIQHIVDHVGLPKVSKNTITDSQRLWEEIRTIRRQGFAESVEETDEGAAGIGVPILGEGGELAGAVAIAGPMERMLRERTRNITLAKEGARRIAAELGLIKRRQHG